MPASIRRWIPSPGTGLLLTVLAVLAWWLRSGIVTSKLLSRAREDFAGVRQNPEFPDFTWKDAAVLGTHYSTWFMIGTALAALLTMKWWFPARAAATKPTPPPVQTTPRYRIILLALVLLAAGLRLPLAAGSLWWDELWNVKFATVGEWRQEGTDADRVQWQPTPWARAAWYFNKPTNHPVLTLPSKACHLAWQKLTGAAPGTFSEPVLRLPVLLAGLAALLLTARLATRLAGERAGLAAAALIALHPWLIRYGVDARSYGLTFFFMAAALYSLERASSESASRRNAWWWAFGACQFFLMWAHVFAHVSICAALFVAAAWLIRRGPPGDRNRQFAQLLVINLTAAALLLTAFLPNLLQVMTWGERNDDGNLLTGSYLLRTLSQIAAGMEPPLTGSGAGIPVLPWWGLAVLGAGGLAAIVAAFRYLLRHQPRAAILLGSSLAFTGLFLAAVKLTDFYFYHRFILAAGISVILLTAIGLSRLPRAWLTGGALVVFAALTFPQTRLLLTRSYAPFRETVADLRTEAARLSTHPPIAVGYGLGSHVMQCYHPAMRCILVKPGMPDNSDEQLHDCIDQARRENRPLFVALGYKELNRLNLPEGFDLLKDAALFEQIGERHGLEPEFTFHLLQLKAPAP